MAQARLPRPGPSTRPPHSAKAAIPGTARRPSGAAQRSEDFDIILNLEEESTRFGTTRESTRKEEIVTYYKDKPPFDHDFTICVQADTEKQLKSLDGNILQGALQQDSNDYRGYKWWWIRYTKKKDPVVVLKDKVCGIIGKGDSYTYVVKETNGGTTLSSTSWGSVTTHKVTARSGVKVERLDGKVIDSDMFALTYRSNSTDKVRGSQWIQFVARELYIVDQNDEKHHVTEKFEGGSYAFSIQSNLQFALDGDGFYSRAPAVWTRTYGEHTIYDKPGLGFSSGSDAELALNKLDEKLGSKWKELVSRIHLVTYMVRGSEKSVRFVVRWVAEYTKGYDEGWKLTYRVEQAKYVKQMDSALLKLWKGRQTKL